MKIKKMIIACAIVICILLCMILIIMMESQDKKTKISDSVESSNEALRHAGIEIEDKETVEEEEEVEDLTGVSLIIENQTGETIDELYLYGNEMDEEGRLVGVNLLEEPIPDGETETVIITEYDEETQWDIAAIMANKEIEMEYTLGSDFIYDSAIIKLGIKDEQLVIVEDVDEEEESQENTEEQESEESE